jgi:Flp pilus assembly protein TadD
VFAGWVSLLVTNFFGFSVVIGQVFFFLFPAICMQLVAPKDGYKEQTIPLQDTPAYLTFLPVTIQTKLSTIFQWSVLLVGAILLFGIGKFWYADVLYAQGYRDGRSGQIGQAVESITHAVLLNPHEPIFHDELSGDYAALALSAFQNKNATQAAALSELALKESNLALVSSPNNVNFWKTRTKVYYTLSNMDPTLNTTAIEALQHAITLSPNDPKIYYNLAILTGRSGDTDTAVKYLLQAKSLKPNYRDAYFALNVFYIEMKKPTEARAILEEYLTKIDANDTDFQQRLTQ